MEPGPRRTALITGASSGIGYELAKVFAAEGHDVALVARTKAALEELAEELSKEHSIDAWSFQVDLSDPAASGMIKDALDKRSLNVDFLVNNAGMGARGTFSELDLNLQLEILQVNMTSLTHLTRLLLPGMVGRKRGRVLNVASTAAFVPGPLMAVYYASKAYVLSLSVALAEELKGTGVTVTALCPGPTRTGFVKKSGTQDTRLFKGGGVMEPSEVALAGYRGMMEGREVVIPGLRNRFLAAGSRLVPRGMAARAAKRLNEDTPG